MRLDSLGENRKGENCINGNVKRKRSLVDRSRRKDRRCLKNEGKDNSNSKNETKEEKDKLKR